MGGRGTESSLVNQINLQEGIDRAEINEIINQAERIRQGHNAVGYTIGELKLRECACCGNYTIPINTVNYRCPVCDWIDDEYQNNYPDSLDGPNNISLQKAKQVWKRMLL